MVWKIKKIGNGNCREIFEWYVKFNQNWEKGKLKHISVDCEDSFGLLLIELFESRRLS